MNYINLNDALTEYPILKETIVRAGTYSVTPPDDNTEIFLDRINIKLKNTDQAYVNSLFDETNPNNFLESSSNLTNSTYEGKDPVYFNRYGILSIENKNLPTTNLSIEFATNIDTLNDILVLQNAEIFNDERTIAFQISPDTINLPEELKYNVYITNFQNENLLQNPEVTNIGHRYYSSSFTNYTDIDSSATATELGRIDLVDIPTDGTTVNIIDALIKSLIRPTYLYSGLPLYNKIEITETDTILQIAKNVTINDTIVVTNYQSENFDSNQLKFDTILFVPIFDGIDNDILLEEIKKAIIRKELEALI